MSLLCEIIAQCGKAEAVSFRQRRGYDALIRSEVLVERGIVQSVTCMECEVVHDAPVMFEDGDYCFACPELGFVPIDRDTLIGLQMDDAKFVALMAEAFDCKRRKSTPVRGATWRIGAIGSKAGDLVIYFHPRLKSEVDTLEVKASLQQEVNAPYRLILTAEGKLEVVGYHTAQLDDVVELDASGREFRSIADLRDLASVPSNNPGGAPNRYGEALTGLIRQRMSDGRALDGRNDEARAVLAEFNQSYPHGKPPSLSSVQDYVTKVRAGQ